MIKQTNPRTAAKLIRVELASFVVINGIFMFELLAGHALFYIIAVACVFNALLFPALFLTNGVIGWLIWRRDRSEPSLKRLSLAALLLSLAMFAAMAYATQIEPRLIKVRRVTIVTDKVTRPISILHVTDIQSARVGRFEERIAARIRELNPDLVLYTGDLADTEPPLTDKDESAKLFALFRSLKPPLGFYGVLGNFDSGLDPNSPADMGGLIILNDRGLRITRPGLSLNLMGLSLARSRETNPGSKVHGLAEQWLQAAAPRDFTILIGHCPDYILSIQDLPADLCLAGHTHGGQVQIPFFGAVFIFSKIPRAWASGFREIGSTRLNVSAGLGNERTAGLPPLRFNCPPEMTLIELRPGH